MVSVRAEKVLYFLLVVIGIASLAGCVFLLSQAESAELALFELTAFTVSVVAVTLAILGSITSIHQTRSVRRIEQSIKRTLRELKSIDKDNESIKRKLAQDYALSRDIAEALAEAGIIEDEGKRHAVAGKIESKIRSKHHR